MECKKQMIYNSRILSPILFLYKNNIPCDCSLCDVQRPVKCQACNINERINNKSLHCEVCIVEMVKSHTSMLLNGTMNDTPRSTI